MSSGSMQSLNLAFRFILELIALVALALWGFSSSSELIIQLVLGLGAPAVAIAIWGTLVAPKAPRRLEDPIRVALEVVIFGVASLAFVAWGSLLLGVLLAASATISLVLMFLWGQRGL